MSVVYRECVCRRERPREREGKGREEQRPGISKRAVIVKANLWVRTDV
jgi:hypothetical protein